MDLRSRTEEMKLLFWSINWPTAVSDTISQYIFSEPVNITEDFLTSVDFSISTSCKCTMEREGLMG